MAMSWEEYQQLYPAPFDLAGYVDAGNQTYAGMDYYSRPQEWLDEYDRMRRANMEWQANYHNGGYSGSGPSSLEMLNPFVQQSGRAYYDSSGQPEYIGDPGPQVDWYQEAAAGRPVIGGSVTPNMTAKQYYGNNQVPSGVPQQLGQPTGQLAYPTGGGLPTPTQVTNPNMTASNNASLSVGQGLQTLGNAITNSPQYSGGGTIGNFWDDGGQQNTGSVPAPMSNMSMGNSFQDWFTKTYGSNYGLK